MHTMLIRTLGLTSLFLFLSGCKSSLPDLSAKLPWGGDEKPKESLYQQPVKMVVIWSPAMYTQPGQVPTRGFGGRIYFYNSKEEAVPVDGRLVIYAFDDSNQQKASQVPDKRFAFTTEQLTKHFSPTQLGASYSIWIPWDAVGNPQADISLLPVFTNSRGGVLTGQQSRNLLPGPETPKAETSIENRVEPSGLGGGQHADSVITHTIGLPESTAARLAASSAFTPTASSTQPRLAETQTTRALTPNTAAFSAPTKESRSWGPVVPRRPIRPAPGSLAHSLPGKPPAPAWPTAVPTAGLPPTRQLPVGPPSPPREALQSVPPSSGQVIYRDVSEIAP